jgi:hypothetical protein
MVKLVAWWFEYKNTESTALVEGVELKIGIFICRILRQNSYPIINPDGSNRWMYYFDM